MNESANGDQEQVFEDLNRQACLLYDQGEYVRAAEVFRKVIDGGETWAYINLGNALREGGSLEEAAKTFEKAISLGDTDAIRNLARVEERLGQFEEAAGHYELAAESGDSLAFEALAYLRREQEEDLKLEQFLNKYASSDDIAAGVLGHLVWDRSHSQAVEEWLLRGAEHLPAARIDLAELLAESNRKAAAVEQLQRGIARHERESLRALARMRRVDDAPDELEDLH